jgi:hypothetical protein
MRLIRFRPSVWARRMSRPGLWMRRPRRCLRISIPLIWRRLGAGWSRLMPVTPGSVAIRRIFRLPRGISGFPRSPDSGRPSLPGPTRRFRRRKCRSSAAAGSLSNYATRSLYVSAGPAMASRDAERLRERLDRSLRAVFDYCRDLSTQLNYLKPQVGRCYYLLDSDDPIRNLSWQEGYADFRTRSTADGGCIERVSMGYTLAWAGAAQTGAKWWSGRAAAPDALRPGSEVRMPGASQSGGSWSPAYLRWRMKSACWWCGGPTSKRGRSWWSPAIWSGWVSSPSSFARRPSLRPCSTSLAVWCWAGKTVFAVCLAR